MTTECNGDSRSTDLSKQNLHRGQYCTSAGDADEDDSDLIFGQPDGDVRIVQLCDGDAENSISTAAYLEFDDIEPITMTAV